jgi:phosphatidylethanolamine-binding protein (PEBP) family uncharacterized protein
MKIFYNDKKISNGEFLKVKDVQVEPSIQLNVNPNKIYTLILHDPDAVGGDKIHWFKVNIKNNDINSGTDILPYVGPAPPPNSGMHHYIFELYEKEIENIPNLNDEDRRELTKLKKVFDINEPIGKFEFTSKNESGGKRRKTRKRKTKRTRKTRRRY